MFLSQLQMRFERGIGDSFAYKYRYGYQAAVMQTECGVVPDHVAEQYIVVQLCETWRELAEEVAAGSLVYFVLCHGYVVITSENYKC